MENHEYLQLLNEWEVDSILQRKCPQVDEGWVDYSEYSPFNLTLDLIEREFYRIKPKSEDKQCWGRKEFIEYVTNESGWVLENGDLEGGRLINIEWIGNTNIKLIDGRLEPFDEFAEKYTKPDGTKFYIDDDEDMDEDDKELYDLLNDDDEKAVVDNFNDYTIWLVRKLLDIRGGDSTELYKEFQDQQPTKPTKKK
jgi:hypothetical protein